MRADYTGTRFGCNSDLTAATGSRFAPSSVLVNEIGAAGIDDAQPRSRDGRRAARSFRDCDNGTRRYLVFQMDIVNLPGLGQQLQAS